MKLPKYILFDQDGTIFNPVEGVHQSLNYALEKLYVAPVPLEAMSQYIGPSLAWSFSQLLSQDPASEQVDRAISFYREKYFAESWKKNDPYPGITQVFSALLQSGRELFVCTSRQQDSSRKILTHAGYSDYFTGIYGSDINKSKSTLLGEILIKHKLDPQECILIGDRFYDVQAALQNGVRCGGAIWGHGTREELADAGASILFERPLDILEYI